MSLPFSRLPSPLRDRLRPVTIIQSARLSDRLGTSVSLASETGQHTGSFKFRGAAWVAAGVPHHHLIAASSGNFGQALACACQLLGKRCTVVMPRTSARVKIDAVRSYGAVVDLIDVQQQGRQARVAELAAADPEAYVASAYDDLLVIEGNSTLGAELAALGFEAVLTPIGGGGLAAGLIQGLRAGGSAVDVIGVEPLLANDAALSFRAGRLIAQETESMTVADGVRTLCLGRLTWAILQRGLADIIEVTEEQIKEAVRFLFELADLKAEPTGALPVAGMLARPDLFHGRQVCCLVSGANVDPVTYATILERASGKRR